MLDVLIIGAGPAGLTAALYAKRYGLDVTVLEGNLYGGQIANAPEVENYPGIRSISGVDLALQIYDQVAALGVEVKLEGALSFDFSGPVKKVVTHKGVHEARTVIVANGARRRKLGSAGEDTLNGRGVSYCATCDGSFYKGKEVAIVGGGNTALEDALFLANICSRVHLIHRRDEFRGNHILAEAVKARENIVIHYDSAVDEIGGGDRVSFIKVRNLKTNITQEIELRGIFIAVGLEPDNSLFDGILNIDSYGYIVAGEDCKTNVPGVFAAGDTRTKALRQVVTAAADGAVAAFEATNFIHTAKSR